MKISALFVVLTIGWSIQPTLASSDGPSFHSPRFRLRWPMFRPLVPPPVVEVVRVPLRIEDTLCFNNYEPDFSRYGNWPWGGIAEDEGACQGMAATVAAFHQYAQFDPTLPPPRNASVARALMQTVTQLHHRGCSTERKVIPGFADLRSFCTAYRREMIQTILSYNVQYALSHIMPYLGELTSGGGSFLSGEPAAYSLYDRQRIREAMGYIYTDLKAGRIPIMLVVQHVVAVYEMRIVYRPGTQAPDPIGKPQDILAIHLNTYDPNGGRIDAWRDPYEWEKTGLPKVGSRRLWSLTPTESDACWLPPSRIDGPFI